MVEQILLFLWMGGYALYVWSAFAFFAVIFFILWFLPARQLHQLNTRLKQISHE